MSRRGSSLSHASLARLRGLLRVDVAALVLPLVAAVIVPAALSPVVVVAQDERVGGGQVTLRILNVRHSVELFANCPLNDYVLLVLVILGIRLEVELIVVGLWDDDLGPLHMHTDGQNALEGEVGVFDVFAVNFFVLVK